MTDKIFLCFGEILWDCLPKGLFLGGAPLNVAFHINQFKGYTGLPISSVGLDFLGKEVIRRMNALSLPTNGVHIHPYKQTGAVLVDLNSSGSAGYQFVDDCAWDEIKTSKNLLPNSKDVAGLIIGTLAFRSQHNINYFKDLVNSYSKIPLYLDINFRQPFVNLELTMELCKKATLIKLNHEELAQIMGQSLTEDPDIVAKWAADLSEICGNQDIVVTAGHLGAGVYEQSISRWHFEKSKKIQVVDTVGAGDSFLATLLVFKDLGFSYEECLIKACRIGEYVATQDGATPSFPEKLST